MGVKSIEPNLYSPAQCRAVKHHWRYKEYLPSQNPISTKPVQEHARELLGIEDLLEPKSCKYDVHSLVRL